MALARDYHPPHVSAFRFSGFRVVTSQWCSHSSICLDAMEDATGISCPEPPAKGGPASSPNGPLDASFSPSSSSSINDSSPDSSPAGTPTKHSAQPLDHKGVQQRLQGAVEASTSSTARQNGASGVSTQHSAGSRGLQPTDLLQRLAIREDDEDLPPVGIKPDESIRKFRPEEGGDDMLKPNPNRFTMFPIR